jgi:hypothetical protein
MRRGIFAGVLAALVAIFLFAAATALAAPEAPTIEPAEVVGSTAKLKGMLNPNAAGEAGSYDFLYRLSASECEGESSTEPTSAFGAQEEPVSAEILGLQPSATYSFCLLASNEAFETAVSTIDTFTTAAAPPAIEGESSGGVTSTAATLSALINPNNQETTYKFEYSTQATGEILEGTIAELPGASPLPATFGGQTAEAKAEPLQPRTQYFYRVVATNTSAETTNGKVETFTAVDAPLVTTGAALGVTRTKASITGTVNPGGLFTSYHFVYGANGEEAKTTPGEVLGVSDFSAHPAGPRALEELKPGTTYHYALVASNSTGARVGLDQTFTTSPATPPSASTGEASGVSQLEATLTGTADTHGLPGTLSFQVALSPEGGSLEPASVVAGSQSGTSVAITFSFGPYLQPGTTYYYRAVATNADGSEAGEWRSFKTTTFPSPFAQAPPSIPLLHIPSEFEEKPTKPLTNAQKLAKALKACHKAKKSKRAKCERQARNRYAPKHKK